MTTRHPASGFTLLETLVAVSILAIVTSGPLYAASRSIVLAESARDQITASYLAQEGIEQVRAMRDGDFVQFSGAPAGSIWNDFTGTNGEYEIGPCMSNYCTLDLSASPGSSYSSDSPTALHQCTSASACPSLYPNDFGVYTISPTPTQISNYHGTVFTREIRVTDLSSDPSFAVRVTSVVTWTFHGTSYTVTMTDILTPSLW